MVKGEKIRLDIHNTLYSIYKFNQTLNNRLINKRIKNNKKEDIAFLYNVTLTTMRFQLHTLKIINKFVKKKIKVHEMILLQSAITQIVFLDFKEYAVINCSVEIAKKLKIYHGLINAILKKIARNKISLKETKINLDDLPMWFRNKTKSLTNVEKKNFLENYNKEPDLHVVFKDKKYLNTFEKKIIKTSDISGFVEEKQDISKLRSFLLGNLWVQDFSSFFPLHILPPKYENKNFLDACSAPGGKSFQILNRNFNIDLNDISKKRIEILKSNLNRLNFKAKIMNLDFIKSNKFKKYDFIIVDSPCSSIGTIRRNPEIFFKTKGPDFKELINIQKRMLEKASLLLNNNGIILYMVCSFLKCETLDQIKNFLTNHDNFELFKINSNYRHKEHTKLIKNNYIITMPDTVSNYNIDGYFAAYLKKIK